MTIMFNYRFDVIFYPITSLLGLILGEPQRQEDCESVSAMTQHTDIE